MNPKCPKCKEEFSYEIDPSSYMPWWVCSCGEVEPVSEVKEPLPNSGEEVGNE